MAKKIIEYKLMGGGTIPPWVADGGYFVIGSTMIGVSVDEDEYYIPADTTVLNEEQFKTRLVNMTMAKIDYLTGEEKTLSTVEKEEKANNWLTVKGFK